VIYRTLSVEGIVDDARRATTEDLARSRGGTAIWRSSRAAGRSYALLALPRAEDAAQIGAAGGATLYEMPVIALAVYPAVPEALPGLLEALRGAGAPAGVLSCRGFDGGVIVEWDPTRTGAEVVLGIVDVELRRWGGGRRAELLSPLPPEVTLEIAARGLGAPQIGPERILEMLLAAAAEGPGSDA